jgi:hypothetical protein
MKSRSIAIIAGGLMACANGRTANPSSLQAQDQALLVVTNDHWLDVNVFAVRGGSSQRLGTIPGFKTDTIPLRLTFVSGGAPVRFVAEPIGLNARHVSDPVSVVRGELVEFRVKNPLNLSSVMVVSR